MGDGNPRVVVNTPPRVHLHRPLPYHTIPWVCYRRRNQWLRLVLALFCLPLMWLAPYNNLRAPRAVRLGCVSLCREQANVNDGANGTHVYIRTLQLTRAARMAAGNLSTCTLHTCMCIVQVMIGLRLGLGYVRCVPVCALCTL